MVLLSLLKAVMVGEEALWDHRGRYLPEELQILTPNQEHGLPVGEEGELRTHTTLAMTQEHLPGLYLLGLLIHMQTVAEHLLGMSHHGHQIRTLMVVVLQLGRFPRRRLIHIREAVQGAGDLGEPVEPVIVVWEVTIGGIPRQVDPEMFPTIGSLIVG
jgi:hypothetical protein